MLAAPHGGFGRRDLVERAAQMDRRRVEAARILPRDRAVERPVELEDAGAVAEAVQATQVACRQDRRADVDELCGARVEQDDACRWQIGEAAHAHTRLDTPAELAEEPGERVRDRL